MMMGCDSGPEDRGKTYGQAPAANLAVHRWAGLRARQTGPSERTNNAIRLKPIWIIKETSKHHLGNFTARIQMIPEGQ
jgi:hypothetical protein